MEKRKPAYDLEAFKEACSRVEKLVATGVALKGARHMGFGPQDMVNAIQTMTFRMFYKSMTSYADHRIWQDVYHVPYEGCDIYLKFTADTLTNFVVLSFKEKGDG